MTPCPGTIAKDTEVKINKKLAGVILVVLIGGSAAEWAITRAVSAITHPPIPAQTSPGSATGSSTVAQVIDGDTIIVRHGDGRAVTVDALGIDAPEPAQCGGPQASANAEQILAHQVIALTFDPVAGRLDTKGHTLAYIWRGGHLYNQEALRAGYAAADHHDPYQRRVAFTAAETDARTHHRGLWAASTCDGDTHRPAGDNTNSTTLPPAKPR